MLGAGPPPFFSKAGAAPAAAAKTQLASDSEQEVVLAQPSRLPLLGPRYAPLTFDLYLPFGHKATAPNLALLRKLARENSDVRLLLHPVLGSDVAERGAEMVFSAWQQEMDGERCFALAEVLGTHAEWLAGTLAEAELAEAAQALDLDRGRLFSDLQKRRLRPQLLEIWQSERNEVRVAPEVWLNGYRLRGLLVESQVREELSRQRIRAYQSLRSGTPLSRLYEQLVGKERGREASTTSLRLPVLSAGPARGAGPATTLAVPFHLDLDGAPRRGPAVSPVTLVLLGSLDTYGTFLVARTVNEVWSRHQETVQLFFQHAPTTDNGRRVAQLLAQLANHDPPAFWRAFDGIIELMKRRFILRYGDLEDLLLRQHIDVAKLERALKDPVQGDAARTLFARDVLQAQRLGLATGPALFLNGRPLPVHQTAELLERHIESELRRGILSRLLSPRP